MELTLWQRQLVSRAFGQEALDAILGIQPISPDGQRLIRRAPLVAAPYKSGRSTAMKEAFAMYDPEQPDTETTEAYLRQFGAAWDDPAELDEDDVADEEYPRVD